MDLVNRLALAAIRETDAGRGRSKRRAEAVFALVEAVVEFATSLRMEGLSHADSEDLPRVLRIGRYLEEAAQLTPEIETLRLEGSGIRHAPTKAVIERALETMAQVVESFSETPQEADVTNRKTKIIERFQQTYQDAKESILTAAASRTVSVEQVDGLLDALSRTRRVLEQIVKADRLLSIVKARNGQALADDDAPALLEDEPNLGAPLSN